MRTLNDWDEVDPENVLLAAIPPDMVADQPEDPMPDILSYGWAPDLNEKAAG